jgi:hypothetical protein
VQYQGITCFANSLLPPQLFSVIVFGCISNKGWLEDEGIKPVCIFNKDGNACRIGNTVALVGFIGALALLVLEALFQSLSSIKIRKRAVLADLGFSAAWAALYLIAFAYLGIAWSKSPYPRFGEGINNARSAVAFSFFSIPVWAGCAYFAWIRWQSGTDMGQFAGGFETGLPPTDAFAGQQAGGYAAVPNAMGDPNAYASTTAGYDQSGVGANNPFAAPATYQAPAY